MYAFGSVGCVGSWFFSSVTSNVKKSLAVIVAPSVAELVVLSLDELLPDALAVFAVTWLFFFGANADATVVAAELDVEST